MPVFPPGSIKALAILLPLVAGARSAGAAQIERLETGRTDLAVFQLNGTIEGGETIALQSMIGSLPADQPVAVVLHSNGGNMSEGMKLGEFFYQAKIPTFVRGFGGYCYSACSLAFLGGRDRITGKPARFKMAGGTLGFHQFSRPRSEEEMKKIYTKEDIDAENKTTRERCFALITYMKTIHEDLSKLHLMMKAPSEGMNEISNEDATALGFNVMGDNTVDYVEASNIVARVKGQ
jgi:hypothetical protein